MPFLVYIVTTALAIGAVLLEIEWLVASPPPEHSIRTAAHPAAAETRLPPKMTGDLSPIYPTSPTLTPAEVRAAAAMTGESRPVGTEKPGKAGEQSNAASTAAVASASASGRIAEVNSSCDVRACASAYRSFRASDCTYQSFGGRRRICDKGMEASRGSTRLSELKLQNDPASSFDARAEAQCNVSLCARRYSSFRASDCTYQPYGGGERRLCER
jgi:hypothetical protein